ncbi:MULTISPECIES: hypothetical protein [Paenibacillus]|nr:hypothetical protein [Paenibacillus alvei]
MDVNGRQCDEGTLDNKGHHLLFVHLVDGRRFAVNREVEGEGAV